MATIEGFGGRVVGNDMVRPQARRPIVNDMVTARRPAAQVRPVARVHIDQYAQRPKYVPQPAPAPQAAALQVPQEQPQSTSQDFSAQQEPETVAPAKRKRRFGRLFSRKRGVIAVAAVVVIAGSAVAFPHMSSALHTTQTVANRIALGASLDMHHTQSVKFVMPQNSILVRSSQLSSFTDAIEGQTITVNIGSTTVTPQPTDIQNWFFTTAGPQSNSTIIEANTSNITSYLTNLVQKDDPTASSDAVSSAATQLAQALVKSNGATVTIQ